MPLKDSSVCTRLIQCITLVSSIPLLTSCSREIDYMAKFCTGYEDVLYIDNEMATFSSSVPLSSEGKASSHIERGHISKFDRGSYYEYNGTFEFVALKNFRRNSDVLVHSVEMRDNYYISIGSFPNKNRVIYYIDFNGRLFRFDEIIESQTSRDITATWKLCGGHFVVN